jgi:hypothetical protein
MADEKTRERSTKPSSMKRADDRGLVSSEPANTTGGEPGSALGGGTATRSGTETPPNPAKARSE